MLKLNAHSLLGQWKEERHPLLRPHRENDTRWLVAAALESATASGLMLDLQAVKTLEKDFFQWRQETGRSISHRQAQCRVTRVLQSLNEQPHITAVLPPRPVRSHRETAMPRRGDTLVQTHRTMALDRHLLTWARQHNTRDAWLFVLAVRLVTRIGLGEPVLLGTLSQLTRRHVDNQWLTLPSHPDSALPDGAHYRLKMPSAVWIPLRAILNRCTGENDTWLLAPTGKALEKRISREKNLRERLNAGAVQCLQEMYGHTDKHKWEGLRSWTSIYRGGRYAQVLNGVPPLWAGLLHHYPLPSDTPIPLLADTDAHHHQPGARYGPLNSTQTPAPLPTLGNETQSPGVYELDLSYLPADWPRQIKRRLSQFLTDASGLSSSQRLYADRYAEDLQQLLAHYERLITELIGHNGSYAQWLLHWAYHLLRVDRNKLSTARTYISRITPITMLLHEGTLNLADWDDELVEEIKAGTLSEQSWKDTTIGAYSQTLGQFIRFCQNHGMLEEVTPPMKERGQSVSTLRTRILTPGHFLSLWHGLAHQYAIGERRQLLALIMALGFYGGLRASEILALTLSDVVIGEEKGKRTCWVEVLGGKTPAARRRIALHVMAPPSVVETLGEWVEYRKSSCGGGHKISDVALFGPDYNPDAFTRRALITPVIEWMRKVLGEGVDFHGLRHAAVSWTLLRLHAAQTPTFADTLFHRYDWMFSEEALATLLNHFCGAEGEDAIARGTMIYRVAKWIGHRDPSTLLQHYAHVLGLIHSDILTHSSTGK
ncbi:site-specific integrase [Halomonas sp. YLGW01]|uniref:tyrosine-type recombinase/integrase n=1 Tax=Halomonas sp. YLGW01 TaxID=2773308 RepID=UPI001781912E|nr:site-specific integrase [Halomonas sp. YLGW01]